MVSVDHWGAACAALESCQPASQPAIAGIEPATLPAKPPNNKAYKQQQHENDDDPARAT